MVIEDAKLNADVKVRTQAHPKPIPDQLDLVPQ